MKKSSKYCRRELTKSLFEQETTLQSLSNLGNPLERILEIVDFEIFRPTLEAALFKEERKTNAGRCPIDPILMFKVLFVQRLYGLSDEQTEYQIKERTSFREFIGIITVSEVPDARTIWKYREDLTKSGAYDLLFVDFHNHLNSLGFIVNEGKIIDASFMTAPRQRNTRLEKQADKRRKRR